MMVKAVDYLEEDPVLTAVKQPRSANRAGPRSPRPSWPWSATVSRTGSRSAVSES